jgi:hypothetical protein
MALRLHIANRNVGLIDPTDIEKINQEGLRGKENPSLRLDKRGLPLVPQPTVYKDDPLVSLILSRIFKPRF